MFAIERIKIIKNHLIKDQKVSVAKLSELLDVTEVTIRRDLEKLENEGFLKRTHGGAVINSYVEESSTELKDDHELVELYEEIANTAYHLVSDYESIMITNGPCNVHIAKRLSKRHNLTVVTNDLNVALEFTHSPTNTIILIGGDVTNTAVYGQMAIDNMRNFSFHHLFMEIDGMNERIGMTVSSIQKATLLQQAIPLADSVTAVCLSHYFGEKSLYRIGSLDLSHRVLTDSKLNDEYKDYVFNLNIPIFTSVDVYEE